MSLRVNSTAKASDNSHLYIGEGTDDAPRIQLVFVAHGVFWIVLEVAWVVERLTGLRDKYTLIRLSVPILA